MENNLEQGSNVKKVKFNKWKLLKNLIIACVVLLIVKFILDKNVFDDMNIERRVNSYLPISVSIQESLYVKQYAIDRYVDYLKTGETKNAYFMLTDEYKEYKSYEEYLKELEGIDFSTFKLQEVKIISEGTYLAPVEYDRNGVLEEQKYIVLINKINNKIIKISPDNFLYKYDGKNEFSKEGMKFTIKNCIVSADAITATIKVKNKKMFGEINIEEIGFGFNDLASKMARVDDGIIKPGEEKTYNIELKTNNDIPKYLKINRNIDDKILRTYTFEL